jgi:hypothetical protein
VTRRALVFSVNRRGLDAGTTLIVCLFRCFDLGCFDLGCFDLGFFDLGLLAYIMENVR